jgi:putative membrane protein
MKMFWFGPHIGGWGWAVGLGSLFFWMLVAVAIVALVRSVARQRPPYQGYAEGAGPYGAQPGPGSGYGTPPEQILAERFARGEIDEDEFHQRMAALRPTGGGA